MSLCVCVCSCIVCSLCLPIVLCLCFIATQELEKDIEKLLVVKEKCIDAEGEIRTLKSFLVSKTSIVEKKKNEVKGDVFFMS